MQHVESRSIFAAAQIVAPTSSAGMTQTGPEIERTLREQAMARSQALLHRAEHHFARRIPTPEIRFDLRGRAAGLARLGPGRAGLLRYNARLLADNAAEFLAQTVAHEVAHLVAFHLHGPRIRPHGPEWRAVMRLFGVPAGRCHRFPVDQPYRRLTRHLYHCPCRTHELTSIRHNRAQRGLRYLCRSCGQPLVAGRRAGAASGD